MQSSDLHRRTITLSKTQDAFIARQIEAGEYANASEVVRAGINALVRDREEFDSQFIEKTREAVRQARAGEAQTYPAEEVFARVRAKLLKRANEEGLT